MKNLKINILNISNNYQNLLLLSKESFETIKIKDLDNHKLVKELEKQEFESLNKNKQELKKQLDEKAGKYGKSEMRLREVISLEVTDEKELEDFETTVKEMLSKEKEFQDQLKLTIEIAKVMHRINSDQLDGAMEIARKENIDKTGSMLLEEDY